jgi:hypothetical protein
MSESHRFKDHHREARIFASRLVVVGILMALLISVLVVRYYNLQVTDHLTYVTQSDRNRVHVQPIAPTRGLIYDRNGVLLAENRPSYTLSLVRERVANLEETLRLLQSLVEVTPADLERFYEQLRQRRRPFEAIPLRYRLTELEIARLAVHEFRLEGVEVDAQLVRHYPFGELFAHSVGYVGRISESDVARFSEEDFRRYSGTHSMGKNGLERQYEHILLGRVGHQNVESNARGRVLRGPRVGPVATSRSRRRRRISNMVTRTSSTTRTSNTRSTATSPMGTSNMVLSRASSPTATTVRRARTGPSRTVTTTSRAPTASLGSSLMATMASTATSPRGTSLPLPQATARSTKTARTSRTSSRVTTNRAGGPNHRAETPLSA